ncbi:MAG TPA: hypothetical protein VNH84_01455, partial [Candidatus Saccharimonadales bacterium]|nr:hypothetical protein [Candidatus Saccharimonadales bacterium]
MEVYGSYETSREMASGRGSSVFAAVKRGGDNGAKYAVKVVFPATGADDPFAEAASSGPDPTEAFLSSVAVQKKAAASSPHVTPVLESGHDARGAWCVTPLYPRSIQSIVAGRVALPHAGVFHVLQAVVAGLLDLKRA